MDRPSCPNQSYNKDCGLLVGPIKYVAFRSCLQGKEVSWVTSFPCGTSQSIQSWSQGQKGLCERFWSITHQYWTTDLPYRHIGMDQNQPTTIPPHRTCHFFLIALVLVVIIVVDSCWLMISNTDCRWTLMINNYYFAPSTILMINNIWIVNEY